MRKKFGLLIALATLCPGHLSADNLSFCYDPYPPYALGAEGAPEGGIKVRLLEEVVSRIDGVTASVTLMPWKRCQHEVAVGHIDGILPLFPNEERESYLAFTIGSIEEDSVFWYSRDRFPAGLEWSGDADELSHLHLGMLQGGFLNAQMENAFARKAGITRVQSVDSLMMMLVNERVDLVATDAAVGHYVLYELGLANEIAYVDPPIASRKSQFGLSKVTGTDRHLDAFNAVLEELAKDGVVRRIYENGVNFE